MGRASCGLKNDTHNPNRKSKPITINMTSKPIRRWMKSEKGSRISIRLNSLNPSIERWLFYHLYESVKMLIFFIWKIVDFLEIYKLLCYNLAISFCFSNHSATLQLFFLYYIFDDIYNWIYPLNYQNIYQKSNYLFSKFVLDG